MDRLRPVVLLSCLAACGGGAIGDDDDSARDAGAPDAIDPCTPVDRPSACPARGIYDSALTVELRPPISGAPIYYTLDGTTPSDANGALYTGPFEIAGDPRRGVAILRAISPPGPIATHSYVFPDHVLTQPGDPDGFPAQWGVTETRAGDYAMDPRVVGDGAAARAGIDSLPSLSIVLAPDDLFGTDAGIYMHPAQEGVAWERPVSAELLFPGGAAGFQIDAGIRIQGGSSTRNWKAAKLSMRLLFKTEYGAGKLEYPLFADSPVARFDTIILDAHLNLSWIHPDHSQRIRAQYVRDQYVSDLQNEVGSLAPHGRFFHLYLNGLYWGVYDVHERPDHSFAAHHLGGDKLEYDVVKHVGSNVVEGNGDAWNQMISIARAGLADDARYQEIQQYLDVDDLIDYMVINFYVGNDDWPHQNWYATRRRVAGAGYRFHSWDAEHVLKDAALDQTGVADADSPAELFQALRAHPEFRARLSARVGELFGPSGALAGSRPAALYQRRTDEIDAAMLLESARWGDNRRPDQPYTRDDWAVERDWLLDQYFPQRSAVVEAQLTP